MEGDKQNAQRPGYAEDGVHFARWTLADVEFYALRAIEIGWPHGAILVRIQWETSGVGAHSMPDYLDWTVEDHLDDQDWAVFAKSNPVSCISNSLVAFVRRHVPSGHLVRDRKGRRIGSENYPAAERLYAQVRRAVVTAGGRYLMNGMLKRAGVTGADNLNQQQIEALHCIRFREGYSREEVARKLDAARATLADAVTMGNHANDR